VALADPKWKAAMDEEYSALVNNKNWHLVPARDATNVIDCKWIYKIKRWADGTVDRFKARLVAKGFKQQYCIDYKRHLVLLSSQPLFDWFCLLLCLVAGIFAN
jgi:hypothetical protein